MISMRYRRVCLGGTFSPLHVGHEALLAKAFELGELVSVGLTSDRFASSGRTRRVETYKARKEGLMALLRSLAERIGSTFEVTEIDDETGFALDEGIQAIIVSEETVEGARRINERRRSLGLGELEVHVIPMVMGKDGRRVSATALCDGASEQDGSPRSIARGAEGGP